MYYLFYFAHSSLQANMYESIFVHVSQSLDSKSCAESFCYYRNGIISIRNSSIKCLSSNLPTMKKENLKYFIQSNVKYISYRKLRYTFKLDEIFVALLYISQLLFIYGIYAMYASALLQIQAFFFH